VTAVGEVASVIGRVVDGPDRRVELEPVARVEKA